MRLDASAPCAEAPRKAGIPAQIGRPAKVIATGGLAVLFDEATDIFDAVDADLTLDGLAILAERAAAQ